MTLVGFVGTFVALGVALLNLGTVSEIIYTRWAGPYFSNTVEGYLSHFMTGATDNATAFVEQLEVLLKEMPDVLREFLNRFSVTGGEVEAIIQNAPSARSSREAAVAAIASPVANTVSRALAFLLLFVGASIVIRVVASIANNIFRLPILRGMNRILGSALGVIQGVVIACIVAGVLSYMAPVLNTYLPSGFDSKIIEATLLFRHFYALTPFKRIL